MTDEAHREAAQRLFQMTQDMHWSTPLICRSRADIMRFFDGFTLVAPGLVPPAQWRPDLHDPLRLPGQYDGEGESKGEPVLTRGAPESEQAEDDRGVAWQLCGIGIRK
jgi:hypothetical protein